MRIPYDKQFFVATLKLFIKQYQDSKRFVCNFFDNNNWIYSDMG